MNQTAPSFKSWEKGIGPEYFTGSAPLNLLKDSVCLIKWLTRSEGMILSSVVFKVIKRGKCIDFSKMQQRTFCFLLALKFDLVVLQKEKKERNKPILRMECFLSMFKITESSVSLPKLCYISHCLLVVIPLIPPFKRINLKKNLFIFFNFPFFFLFLMLFTLFGVPSLFLSNCSSKI